jgi:uncharacterized protein YbcI
MTSGARRARVRPPPKRGVRVGARHVRTGRHPARCRDLHRHHAGAEEYFGKGPEEAKPYMVDGFRLIVMRGSRTVAESTMLEFGQEDRVRDFRQHFENEMTRLIEMVEELPGREVLGDQSQVVFEPEVVVELFFFDETPRNRHPCRAEGQLGERSVAKRGETPPTTTSPATSSPTGTNRAMLRSNRSRARQFRGDRRG